MAESNPSPGEILERAIAEDPHDLAAHAAYADWLTQQGDVRGEFIQVQLALEDSSRSTEERNELRRRESELFTAHGRDWLGPLADFALPKKASPATILGQGGPLQIRLSRGWLDSLRIPQLDANVAKALSRCPVGQYLRSLEIEFFAYNDIERSVSFLGQLPAIGTLRKLQLGTEEESNYIDGSVFIPTVLARMTRLESLHLFVQGIPLDKLFSLWSLPQLRVMQVHHAHDHPLETLASNPAFANLEVVQFHPHAAEPGDGAYLTLDGVVALAHSPHLRKLRHLQLHMSDMGDEGCQEIVASGILKTLRILDLMYGRVTDEGARILASSPDLANLEVLNLSNNRLTSEGIAVLKKILPRCVVADQYDPDDDTDEYLMQGDWE